MELNIQPTLKNELITIRPLRIEDSHGLFEVMKDPLIWDQHPAKERATQEGFSIFLEESINSRGAMVVLDNASEKIIGSSRYKLLNSKKAIEIGWTVLARTYWGGKFNFSMKSLMMNHAFKVYENVLLYIAKENFRSQKAAEKIGGIKLALNHELHLLQKGNDHLTFCLTKDSLKSLK